ncbi:cytochrome c oxidase assembly protein [Glaciihabitans sp. dw_435]|uniref:cytochrome c oxidase assembly protein n=1 Tax=Glaciihabitans sp. dw_435 TaxID=2720081 RepID=UPI001BD1FCFC|nr:cytochrome c oxidase assembly protein [Glaciihabitans sp. dw_435]
MLYALGIRSAARAGVHWKRGTSTAFYVLGLGSYAFVSFGFLSVYTVELRWAFTTKIAVLLFAVPALISLGKPVALARIGLSGLPARVTERVLASWPVRLVGNTIFAPLLALVAFSFFLTPLSGALRENGTGEAVVTVLVPLIGLLMVLPIAEQTTHRTSMFITAEFMLLFLELLLDAIPAILLRLNDGVLDHVPAVMGSLPTWFPSALHDQHLSGDFLWFIAEAADVPVLIFLFIRWSRVDKHEATDFDELSDDEMAALTAEHLRR